MEILNLVKLEFISFFFSSKYLLFVLGLLYLGIVLDSRFLVKYRIFFLLVFFYFSLFIFYLIHNFRGSEENLIFLIKDIFWFTLFVNLGFFWHICILDWLYQLFRSYQCYYICFLITRISFITSLFFPLYLLELMEIKYYKFEEELIINKAYKQTFLKKYFNFYHISGLIKLLLLYFLKNFTLYVSFLIGKFPKRSYFSWSNLLIFLIFLIISYLLGGIPRLYLIWIYIFIYTLIKNTREIYLANDIDFKERNIFIFIYNTLTWKENSFKRSYFIHRYYVNLHSPGFFSEFKAFSNYFVTALYWAHGVILKHPFLYYPPRTLFLIFMRHEMKNYYEWGHTTDQGDFRELIENICLIYNFRPSKEEFEEYKKTFFLRFKNLMRKSSKKSGSGILAYARPNTEDPKLVEMFSSHPAIYVGNITREGTTYALFSLYTHKIPQNINNITQKTETPKAEKAPLYFFRAQQNPVPFVKVKESYLSTTFVAIEASEIMKSISLKGVEEGEPSHEECVRALQDQL